MAVTGVLLVAGDDWDDWDEAAEGKERERGRDVGGGGNDDGAIMVTVKRERSGIGTGKSCRTCVKKGRQASAISDTDNDVPLDTCVHTRYRHIVISSRETERVETSKRKKK